MHTNYFRYIIILVFLWVSCQTVVKPEQPSHFLTIDQMTSLLIDIALIKSGKDYNSDLLREKGIRPTAYIYKKHGIDSAIYQENNQWYASRPKIYHALFLKVRKRLEAKKKILDDREQRMLFLQDVSDSIGLAIDRMCRLDKEPFGILTVGQKLSDQVRPLTFAGFEESLQPFFLELVP